MKTKFLLILLTLNGLLLGANSAFAYTGNTTTNERDISTLSHTISNLIDLDGDAHSLVELAIHRALIAKSVRENSNYTPGQPIVNGKVANPNAEPIVNGEVVRPHYPIINGRVVKHRPPIINGIIIQPPTPTSSRKTTN